MKNVIKALLIVAVLGLSFILSTSAFNLPNTLPGDAPGELFSSSRAMRHVEKIAGSVHPPETAEHDAARDYIIGELSNLGLKPEVQKTLASYKIWGDVVSGNVENIYAVLPGTGKTGEAILMAAHYDSSADGPGAMDDASGVAALLETLRAIKSGNPLKNDVIFLFTDREEDGLLGAAAFAAENPLLKDVKMALNFEARGNSGPVIMFETGEQNGWFMDEFRKAVPYPVAYSFAYDVYKSMPNNTDFTVFKEAVKSGFNFAPILGYETYHTMYDNVKNFSQGTLQHEGTYALSLVKHFGNLSLSQREENNAVYFTLFNSVLILYSDNLALPFAIIGLIIFCVAFVTGYRKKLISIKKTLLGFLLSVLSLAAAAGIGYGGLSIFRGSYLNSNTMMSAEEFIDVLKASSIWMLVMVLLTVLVLFLIYWLLRKRVSFRNQLYGTLMLWAALTLATSILFKSASYLFLWPFAFTSIGLLIQMSISSNRYRSLGYLILFILSAISCILIFLPATYLLFESMTIMMAFLVTIVSALPLGITLQGAFMYIGRYDS